MRKQNVFVALLSATLFVACGGTEPVTSNTPTEAGEQDPASDVDPDAVEDPVEDPVVEDPVEDPVIEDPVEDPVVEDPVEDPVVEDPVEDPVVEDPVEDPVEELDRPTIVAMTPADGAVGVRPGDTISITFDRPMKSYWVQQAFSSQTLGDVEFTWTNGERVLTITPVNELELAEGEGLDPSVIDALEYDVTIAGTARDTDDVELGEDITFTFTTAKYMVGLAPRVDSLTRTALSNGTVHGSGYTTLYAGDSSFADATQLMPFFAFDLADMPLNDIEIVDARLELEITGLNNEPFADLGYLRLEQASYTNEINQSALEAPAAANIGTLMTQAGMGVRSKDVTTAVTTENVLRGLAQDDLIQFRMQFQFPYNQDDNGDSVQISRSSLELSISFFAD
jgi:hypothetical protein